MKTMNEDHRNVIDANAQEMHTSLGELNSIGDSIISSFYAGKSIFITGASGFMGKVLVEKLLRSCPDVKSIYILLRTKKNVDPCDRLDELIRSKVCQFFSIIFLNNVSGILKLYCLSDFR